MAILQPPRAWRGGEQASLRLGQAGETAQAKSQAHLSCSHVPGSVASFIHLRGGLSPIPTPPSMLFAHPPSPQFWPPPPHTHWIVGTGEPEAWQGRYRDCPTRVVTWPKPSATRSCGATADKSHHCVFGVEKMLASSPPKSLCRQRKAQAPPYPSSLPISGSSSRRPSRTTQVQPPHQSGLFIQCLSYHQTQGSGVPSACSLTYLRVSGGKKQAKAPPTCPGTSAHHPALDLKDLIELPLTRSISWKTDVLFQ